MKHSFYTQAPVIGPVYTLQYFDIDDAANDTVFYTDDVMAKIREVTKGEEFYYQFDNPNNTAHCVKAHFNQDGGLTVDYDEVLMPLPGSDLLTEKAA